MKEAQLQEMMARLQEDVKEVALKQVEERISQVKQLIESYRLEFRYISHEDKKVYREVTRSLLTEQMSNRGIGIARAH